MKLNVLKRLKMSAQLYFLVAAMIVIVVAQTLYMSRHIAETEKVLKFTIDNRLKTSQFLQDISDTLLVSLDQAQRVEGHLAQADHPHRIEQVDNRPQMLGAVPELGGARSIVAAIGAARVAEDGVGDEHPRAVDAGACEECVEGAPGLISAEGHTGQVCAKPSGRLRDEQHLCIQRPVARPERPSPPLHPGAPPTRLRRLDNRQERRRTHIRNTPNRVSGIGAFSDAAIPSPSTVRVSAGSMMPSSQSRAVLKYGLPSCSYRSTVGALKSACSSGLIVPPRCRS
jgi:hypothetical protein